MCLFLFIALPVWVRFQSAAGLYVMSPSVRASVASCSWPTCTPNPRGEPAALEMTCHLGPGRPKSAGNMPLCDCLIRSLKQFETSFFQHFMCFEKRLWSQSSPSLSVNEECEIIDMVTHVWVGQMHPWGSKNNVYFSGLKKSKIVFCQ